MLAQHFHQLSETEACSKNILGPAYFEISELAIIVDGSTGANLAPDSPRCVHGEDKFSISLKLEFNKSPLTSFLIELDTEIHLRFVLEDISDTSVEKELATMLTTLKDTYVYRLQWTGTAATARLSPGLYAVAAIAQIGPVNHGSSQPVVGYGYLAGKLLQVAETSG